MLNIIKQGTFAAPVSVGDIPSYNHDVLLDKASCLDSAIVHHFDFLKGCKEGFEGFFAFNLQGGSNARSFRLVQPDASDVANGIASHLLSVPFTSWYAGWWFGYISAYAYYVESYEWEMCLGVLAALSHALLLN